MDAVNVTLGLPIVRTSVDHGTAYDLAGTGKAHPGSLMAAVRHAALTAQNRRAAPPRITRSEPTASISVFRNPSMLPLPIDDRVGHLGLNRNTASPEALAPACTGG